MRSYLLTVASALILASLASAGDLRNFDDAALRAIQFVDDKEGWAVGDEGLCGTTSTAGPAWEGRPPVSVAHCAISISSTHTPAGSQDVRSCPTAEEVWGYCCGPRTAA